MSRSPGILPGNKTRAMAPFPGSMPGLLRNTRHGRLPHALVSLPGKMPGLLQNTGRATVAVDPTAVAQRSSPDILPSVVVLVLGHG
jgi:hypothetical protein